MATLLNTNIRGDQIVPATISGGHLNTDVSPSDGQVLSYNDSGSTLTWSDIPTLTINEVPTGNINGTNVDFTLANTPISDSEKVYLNGLLQEPGAGNDYTISGDTITFNSPPVTDDILLVTYLINSASVTNVPYGYSVGGHGGSSYLSTIDRILFPFDSGTASHVGNLSGARAYAAGCNSSNYGYSMGGYNGSDQNSIVDRIIFPFDSGTASHVGNLNSQRSSAGGCNSSNYGYAMSGDPGGGVRHSTVARIIFPFDSGTGSDVGSITARTYIIGGYNSSNYGYCAGGAVSSSSSYISEIDRLSFPFDSGTASHVGDLSSVRGYLAGCNSSNYGFTMNGYVYYMHYYSTIDRVTFPFNSGTAVHIGNLSGNRASAAGCNSSDYGYCLGGDPGSGIRYSIIDRVIFPFDSGTASHVGNLSGTRHYFSGCDGTDFNMLFV